MSLKLSLTITFDQKAPWHHLFEEAANRAGHCYCLKLSQTIRGNPQC